MEQTPMVSPQSWDRGMSIFFFSDGDTNDGAGDCDWTLCGCAQGPGGLSLYFLYF
jgi:hypothetical protein